MNTWPRGTTELAERIRNHDWGATTLGPIAKWPAGLRSVVTLLLDSPEPMCLLWGADAVHLYNDAFVPLLGKRHPRALGERYSKIWPEVAPLRDRRFESVRRSGEPAALRDYSFLINEDGVVRERFFTVTGSPVRDDESAVVGVLQTCIETTPHVEAAQRLRLTEARLREQRADLTHQLALADELRDESIRQRLQVSSALRESEERLRLAMAAGRLATWDWDLKSGRVVWSDELYTMLGYEVGAIAPSIRTWRSRMHPADVREAFAALELARTSKREFVHRFRLQQDHGLVRWCSARGRYFYDSQEVAVRMICVMQDVTDEVRAEHRLRDSERRQRALIEGLPQLIWRAQHDGRWNWCSPQWTEYTGLSLEESLDHGWQAAVHPDDRGRVAVAWRDSAGQPAFDLEYRIGHVEHGQYRWFQTRALSLHNDERNIVEWLGTSTDVDELRQARERQAVLVAELQHRTRNLIGVVRSVARQTAERHDSVAELQNQLDERLAALGRVHGLLSRAERNPITLDALIRMELDALIPQETWQRIRIEGPQVRLRSSIVQTLALALHELTTNALKHGALLTPQGRLAVTWSVPEAESGERRLLLDWVEGDGDAASRAETPSHHGYGRELIERMLPYALGTSTRYHVAGTNVRCTIELPLQDPYGSTLISETTSPVRSRERAGSL